MRCTSNLGLARIIHAEAFAALKGKPFRARAMGLYLEGRPRRPQGCPLRRLGPAVLLHVPAPLPFRLALSVSRALGSKPAGMNSAG